MGAYARERARERIARAAVAGLDLVSFWREASDAIDQAMPSYGGHCWYTLDPTSLLITSHFNEEMPEVPSEWLAQEYYEDDVNNLIDVVRSARGISTLHEATGGDPASSPRWHQNMEYGGDQELVAALRTSSGEAWGALGMYRESNRPLFDADEQAFVRSIAPLLADGARRALLVGEATDPEDTDAPGMLVLSTDWDVVSATPAVEQWVADLPDGDWPAGRLPSAVLTVAAQARRVAESGGEADATTARVRARSGRWLVLHGATLAGTTDGPGAVAVIVEPAHPARISSLLMSAYGLTDRERDVTRLVLQGASTSEIARDLTVSAHTVQQHLKSVFEKTGVRSRRELVGRVFFSHYEPRVRDNERRAVAGRPLRGGPAPEQRAGRA